MTLCSVAWLACRWFASFTGRAIRLRSCQNIATLPLKGYHCLESRKLLKSWDYNQYFTISTKGGKITRNKLNNFYYTTVTFVLSEILIIAKKIEVIELLVAKYKVI